MSKQCLLLFAKSSYHSKLTDPIRLSELINQAEADIQASWAYFEELLFYVDNQKVEVIDTRNAAAIEDYNSVYFRFFGDPAVTGHALAAARVCSLKSIPFVDSEVLRTGSQNKITQYINLHEAKVSIPRSLMGAGQLLGDYYEKYGFTFPFILKDISGSRGQSNYLVKTKDELAHILAKQPDTTFVVQDFLPNTGDYRVIVFGDQVKMIIERTAVDGSHLNNTSQGGGAKVVPVETLPEQVRADCVRAAAFYGRQIAGVDIVQSKADNQYYCFEVNRAPQIENASFESEKSQLLADYLAQL